MDSLNLLKQSTVRAVTSEVLPKVGLAYLVDGDNRTWTVTRQSSGSIFDSLQPGRPCSLTLEHYEQFTIVGRCEPLN